MISKKVENLVSNSSTIRAMFEEGKRLAEIYGEKNVFDFSIGNPNVNPPDEIKAIINEILNEENPMSIHGYMNNSGYEDVRENIAKHLTKKYNLELNHNNILMTCGAAGGLNVILKTILNPEDEVIIFTPYFSEYINYINNFDGKVVICKTNLDTFEPNLYDFESKITSKTKAVIINTPNNPTGVIYSNAILESIGKILNSKQKEYCNDIYLISDEPYREIVYDGAEIPCILKYYDNSFIGYSYSKSLSLPGERIGYIVTNPNIADFENIISALNIVNRILGFVNAPSLFQKVIGKSLHLEVDSNIYKKNRDLIYNHLTSIGIECIKPEGAFYLFPKSPIEDDKIFCEKAKEFNILLVPGSAFGCPGYFRLSYCTDYTKLSNSLNNFTELMQTYNK